MRSEGQPLRIALCAYFLNAGGTSRTVEIAKCIRNQCEGRANRSETHVDLRIFGNEGPEKLSYERLVRDAGFRVEHFYPKIEAEMWESFLEAERNGRGGFYPPPYESKAVIHIRYVIEALKKFQPTIVACGLFSEVSVAAKILNIPTISFRPIPDDSSWMRTYVFKSGEAKQEQKEEKPSRSPYATLHQAALECGWNDDSHGDMTSMLKANEVIVCDLQRNYPGQSLLDLRRTHFVGPIFAHSSTHASNTQLIDLIKQALFVRNDEVKGKIFITMGSTGEKSFVLESVKAICNENFNVVIALPPTGCTKVDVERLIGSDKKNVFVTTEFVPSDKIAPLVDVVVSHGGQGSVQNALASGTPIVGVAMQSEQEFNLDNVVKNGAGIHLSKDQWTAETIRRCIVEVIATDSYREAAAQIREEIISTKGSEKAAEKILAFCKAGPTQGGRQDAG
jgi:UDP-N-acetylglucosamine transferase subunit ALG13